MNGPADQPITFLGEIRDFAKTAEDIWAGRAPKHRTTHVHALIAQTLRQRLSGKLHMWAARLYDDFHTITLTHTDGSNVEFCCYWQWTGHWDTDTYADDCDCGVD